MITKPSKIPRDPGVYLFKKGRTPLYVGKALNIKNRVSSYFQNRAVLPAKIQKMLEEADRLVFKKTDSEIGALILEAELIKKHRPRYNLLMRDDKNYFFVGITKEDFPRIFLTHQPFHDRKIRNSRPEIRNSTYIGPFTSGEAVKTTLRMLRRIFPFCTCKGRHNRACLNSEIGRCPGYCCLPLAPNVERNTNTITQEYRKNITAIKAILNGKKYRLLSDLKKEMRTAVVREEYEHAAQIRDQLWGLERIFSHRFVLKAPEERYPWNETIEKLKALLGTDRDVVRMEGYDISNISGTGATGSMVVFTNGFADKTQYRKFRIKTVGGISDVDMHKEVLRRRFAHKEWLWPDVIIMDGGKPQLSAALSVVRELRLRKAPIITALAKREEILFIEGGKSIHLQKQDLAILHLFQRIRDESHRFAQAYHHKLREMQFKAS